ncbi:hypothetical protein GCM10007866_04530 [Gluconobacter albidus]|uniref:Uncharacterized protein n=1 Tax=Gluconobacter albidus TaxID=318683 RepID=A0ABQ5WY57_9PROT|nr:hypothetical protein AA3250_1006 [Gluconobacter albidus NBRC 3250]GLQ68005.1 hypothetical protein GCM10007866_04530 [Gluconobacter albidus]
MLIVAERAGLFEKRVNQRGFAMIDVRDDGDITEFHVVFQTGGIEERICAVFCTESRQYANSVTVFSS